MLNTILTVCSMMIAVLLPFYWIRTTKKELRSQVASGKEWANEFATNFYNAAKMDMAQELPKIAETLGSNMMKSFKFSQLGKLSGESRQMNALENDIIAAGIDQKFPGMGDEAAKWLKKYPMLKKIAPMLMEGRGNGQNQQFNAQGGY